LNNIFRAPKRAKRSGDSPITGTKAVDEQHEDSAPETPTPCPHLGIQNALSHLVQPHSRFGKGKSSHQHQTRDGSLEYTRNILAGAETLGIEMTPRLQKDFGSRYGQPYSLPSFPDRIFEPGNVSNGGAAICDIEDFIVSQGYYEAVHDFEFKEDDWGSDYAGIGHQFANLSIGEDKAQLRH
jgi:opacity protein-like surface antigen